MFRFLCIVSLALATASCSESRERSDAGSDAARDTGTDVVTDSNEDGRTCPLVNCQPPCRTFIRDGCEECLCPQPNECNVDSDCVLAQLTGTCCPECEDAYPRAVADANQCVVERYTPRYAACAPENCPEIPCPTIACARALQAVCESGSCRAADSCRATQVETPYGCAPPCTNDSDCVVRTNAADCCGGCPTALHVSQDAALRCFVGPNMPTPADCAIDPAYCMNIGCPDVECPPVRGARCGANGVCEAL